MGEDNNNNNNNEGLVTILLAVLLTTGLFTLSFLPFFVESYINKLDEEFTGGDKGPENIKK